MYKQTLERALDPLLSKAAQDSLGFSIKELNESIIDKLDKPVLRFKVDVAIPFKRAKREFRKRYFSDMLKAHLGNVAQVARVTGLDRRSVHRAVRQLHITVDAYRAEMIRPAQYRFAVVDDVVRDCLEDFRAVITPRKLGELYQSIMATEIKDVLLRESTFEEAEQDFERQYLETALAHYGSVTQAARNIGLRPETLFRKMRSLSIA